MGKSETFNLKPRRGRSIYIIHAGRSIITVEKLGRFKQLKFALDFPSRDDADKDIVMDFGGREKFHVVPIFYSKKDPRNDPKAAHSIKISKSVKKRRYSEYGGLVKQMNLAVHIDYGFFEAIPSSKGNSSNVDPPIIKKPRRGGRAGLFLAAVGAVFGSAIENALEEHAINGNLRIAR